jgi:ketosteroid isomerase-like protein
MKRIACALVLLAACGGRAPAPEEPTPEKPLTPAEVVAAGSGAAEQYRQAWEVRSFDALAELYAQDLDVIVVHQGESHHGWTAVQRYLKRLLGTAAEVHMKMSEVTVTALGPAGAAVAADLRREINDGTSAVIEDGSLTLALRKDGDRWLIVSEHFSFPPR